MLLATEQSRGDHFRGVATFDHHAGVWVEEAGTCSAAEQRARYQTVSITEGVAAVLPTRDLPVDRAFALEANELAVERVELLECGLELVFIPLDCFSRDLGVEFVVRHVLRLNQLAQE